ncbi:hypothetical protein [Halobellus ordinarius]|uniref:hypothetical protein n=1 Tax=Halobellus ordinarius TaxID=3075120 RepID=UPI0028806D42|nr:hypothetical protein [Halobellus sp. ZY16]
MISTVPENVTELLENFGISKYSSPFSARTWLVHFEPSSCTPWTTFGMWPTACRIASAGTATVRPSCSLSSLNTSATSPLPTCDPFT